jgi:RNA polymerase sigma-70 factor (ECF subfamily)
VAETDDLVQVALLRALRRIGAFDPRSEGAFLAYLRQIVLNLIREEHRKAASHGATMQRYAGSLVSGSQVAAVSEATFQVYEAALETLGEKQRHAVILRLEFDWSYARVAEAISAASPDAARMIVQRALVRLARAMQSSTAGPEIG